MAQGIPVVTNSSHTPPSWHVYLLHNSKTGRTYIGATTDPVRRLRQHRGELQGGAKATSKCREDWRMVCFLAGFQDKSTAYRWEKILKMRAAGAGPRREAFGRVSQGICPCTVQFSKIYPVPFGLSLSFPEEVPISSSGGRKKKKKTQKGKVCT